MYLLKLAVELPLPYVAPKFPVSLATREYKLCLDVVEFVPYCWF